MVKSTLACGLQECLSKEWMGDNFSDFRVVVDGSEYFCHKFILSACSTFFKGLLRTNFREKKEECVELKNMSKETFDVIINAIYKGVDGLTVDNIISVWQATHMLDIPFLIEECESFVLENMSLDNYIAYYEVANLLHSETVINFTIGFMKENFEPFCVTETFLEFSFPMLFSFVDDDCLKVKSEDLVLESIISWVSYAKYDPEATEVINPREGESAAMSLNTPPKDQHNSVQSTLQLECPNSNVDTIGLSLVQPNSGETTNAKSITDNDLLDRKKCLVELLSTARTFLASRSYLEKIRKHPLVISCVDAHEIIYEALLYKWRSVSFPSNFVIPHRNCSGKRNVMAFVRGDNLYVYNLIRQQTFIVGIDDATFKNEDYRGGACDSRHPNLGYPLSSIDSTLCFLYFKNNDSKCKTGKYNHKSKSCRPKYLAVIDENKKITNLGTICELSRVELVSINGVFVNICDSSTITQTPEGVFSCVDLKFASKINHACVFQERVLIFYEYNSSSRVRSCNIYTKSIEEIEFTDSTIDITSIQKCRQMFTLQKNGTLKEITVDDENKIQFIFVSQMWTNSDVKLNGTVYYKNELLLFCFKKPDGIDATFTKSVPGIFEKIKFVEIDSESKLVPWVVPDSWLTSNKVIVC